MDWRGRLAGMGKQLALTKAGDALAAWLLETGWSVQELQAALDRGDPVLANAIATIPRTEWSAVQGLARPVLASIGPNDYPVILQRVADYPGLAPHAQLLSTPQYFHRHFAPAVDQARAWLAGP